MDDRPLFHFHYPLEVRYADLDAQGHVNHACYLSYMEMARFKYFEQLGIVDPAAGWDQVGMIVAEASCAYHAPLHFPQTVAVYVRTAELGNKSFKLHYRIERSADGGLAASGRTVLVAYDYPSAASMRVPAAWRARIAAFEQFPAGGAA